MMAPFFRQFASTAATLTVLLGLASPSLALSWNGYTESRHDRFYQPQTAADPARQFIGESFDWSGVGTFNSSGWWWATMISDQYFLSAAHIGPSNDPANVRFYRTNDPNGEHADISIDTSFGQRIAGTDLWLGKLQQAPPSWVERYPLIKRNDSTNYVSYLNPTVYIVGHKSESPGYTNMSVGKNEISSPWSWSWSRTASGRTLDWTFDQGNSGFGADEATTIGGDSSGPTFVPNAYGGMALAGIHWLYDTDTNISAYTEQIVAAVPEPITVVTDLPGDVNRDFQVSFSDLISVLSHLGQGPRATHTNGDIDADGYVTGLDVTNLLANFGKKLTAPADFDQDFDVDSVDLSVIYGNWLKSVKPGFSGDANNDGVVNAKDLFVFNRNMRDVNAATAYNNYLNMSIGTLGVSGQSIPEPASVVIAAALLSLLFCMRSNVRRR